MGILLCLYNYICLLCLPKKLRAPKSAMSFPKHSNRLGPTTPNATRWEPGFVWKLCDNLKIQGRDHQVQECIGLENLQETIVEFHVFLPPIQAVKKHRFSLKPNPMNPPWSIRIFSPPPFLFFLVDQLFAIIYHRFFRDKHGCYFQLFFGR